MDREIEQHFFLYIERVGKPTFLLTTKYLLATPSPKEKISLYIEPRYNIKKSRLYKIYKRELNAFDNFVY